jgi:hypothetical protein
MNRTGKNQILVLLLLLVSTGQSLAALLAPCILPEMQTQQEAAMEMVSASQPASHEMAHHHALPGHTMPASEPSGMNMSSQNAMPAMDQKSAIAHPDYNCCQGLCACILMGNINPATASRLEQTLVLAGMVLPAYPEDQISAPFPNPLLRPPIRLA